eukprot:7424805-Alexandrium_andersonii.AAC.1
MSASLVGSEMCIRDRITLAHATAPEGAPRSLCGGGRPLPTGRMGHSGAVSYTHLTLPTICSV